MKVHFRTTSSRCHRSNVSGVTTVPSSRSALRHRDRPLGEQAALCVGEDDPPPAELLAQHTVLSLQIFDDGRLLALQLAGT